MIRGTFLGIETAKKGLLAARGALDTTSHNIANANTEGYSRQVVNLRASFPLAFPGPFVTLRPGQIGTGAEISSITRVRSQFIDAQIYSEGGDRAMYQILSDSYTRVEDILGEPGANAISGLLEGFFDAWEDLSNDPESASARTNLREATLALTTFVNETEFKLEQELRNINEQLVDKVDQLNSIANQIAGLNKQIVQLEGGGSNSSLKANDLKDRRDMLVEEMSQLVNARVLEHTNGSISVLISGHPIVSGEYAHPVSVRTNPADPNRPIIQFSASRIPLEITSGEIQGLIRMRDEEIPQVVEGLSQLVSAFTNRVNKIHLAGYGLDGLKGRTFFADHEQRRAEGGIPLASTVTLDTTLDELGVDAGDFFVQGQRIEITAEEVQAGKAITLGDLLKRIEAPSVDIRATLDDSLGFKRIIISQFNPIDADTPLTIKDGSSNFFEVTGLDTAQIKTFATEPPYQNSLYNFRLNPAIMNNLNAIAAAGDDGQGFPGPGDNRTALAIGDLKNDTRTIFSTTFNEFYQGVIATLGSSAQSFERGAVSQTLVMEQLEARRQEISGVNLDEEAVNLIRFQRAFEASSRALTTLDEILSLIVNRLGTSGR